jgi:DNA polymerase III subunit delta'
MSATDDGRQLPPWLQRQLQALLQQRGHALLLSGPPGLGQYPLALALARAWLCEHADGQGACGQCDSCHAVDVRTHPDLCVLMPETLAIELGWPLDEKTQDRIDKKEIKPSRLIRVDAARDVVAFSQTTRSRGHTKVVLIYPADRLNIESANTLLKTLEEPSGAVRFVLASEATHALLPTVRSRCQAHPMEWPGPDEVLPWLEAATRDAGGQPLSSPQLQTWWRAAGGRPESALEWIALGLPAEAWGRLPRAVAQGDWSLLADWPVARQMEVLQKICHDLMVSRTGGQPRFFAAADLPPPPGLSALVAWQRQLQEAARTMEHPFSAGLLQEAWAGRAQAALALHSTS